jgi:pilus assembly protein Flp/PilA
MLGAEVMVAALVRFVKDESGATAIEYALIAILISTVIIVGATALGTQLNSTYQSISDSIPAI